MAAVAQLKITTPRLDESPDEVLIHVRFRPDGQIATIDGCPEGVSLQDWYVRLRVAGTRHYQTFAGGRGFFRIPRELFESISGGA
jgi:hypothetical protein